MLDILWSFRRNITILSMNYPIVFWQICFVVVKRIAIAVKKTVNAEEINIIQSNERAAFQQVGYFHVHVIPRFERDSMTKVFGTMLAPTKLKKATREELDKIAKEMRQNLWKTNVPFAP